MKQTVEDLSHSVDDPHTDIRGSEIDLSAWTRECWMNRWKLLAAVAMATIAVTALDLARPAQYKATALISLTKSASIYFAQNQNAFFWPNEDPVGRAANRQKIDLSGDPVSVGSSYSQNGSFGALAIEVTAANPKTARLMAEGVADIFVSRADALDPSAKQLALLEKTQSRSLKIMSLGAEALDREKKQLASRDRSLRRRIPELKGDAIALVVLGNQLDSLPGERSRIESQLLEIDLARVAYENTRELQVLNEGKIKLLSVSAAKRERPKLVTNAVFAGLAGFLAMVLVILARQNRAGRKN